MKDLEYMEARLRKLEDVEAIRSLKARYFACCDGKDAAGVRECFAPGSVRIDYGRIGVFENRDQLVEVFETLGCHAHIVEMHHGVNPQIAVRDDSHAHGTWGLYYQMFDTCGQTMTQLGAYYEDEYRKIGGEWKIAATRCVVTSALLMSYGGTTPTVQCVGSQLPAAVGETLER